MQRTNGNGDSDNGRCRVHPRISDNAGRMVILNGVARDFLHGYMVVRRLRCCAGDLLRHNQAALMSAALLVFAMSSIVLLFLLGTLIIGGF